MLQGGFNFRFLFRRSEPFCNAKFSCRKPWDDESLVNAMNLGIGIYRNFGFEVLFDAAIFKFKFEFEYEYEF